MESKDIDKAKTYLFYLQVEVEQLMGIQINY